MGGIWQVLVHDLTPGGSITYLFPTIQIFPFSSQYIDNWPVTD